MSKKQSDTSTPPEPLPVIYLDENIERDTAIELREFLSDWQVEVHREHYPHDPGGKDVTVSDAELIQKCGENGWILVSADDKMRLSLKNQEVAKQYRTKVFLFPHRHHKGSEYRAALITGRSSLIGFARKNAPPFFARITMKGDVYHLDKDRQKPATSQGRTRSKYGDHVLPGEATVAVAKE
jgi:hypothetical protein